VPRARDPASYRPAEAETAPHMTRGALDTGIGSGEVARRALVNSLGGSGGTFAEAEMQPGEPGTFMPR
jgi:hypothetical protein